MQRGRSKAPSAIGIASETPREASPSLRKLLQSAHQHPKAIAIQNAVGLSAPQGWALRILHGEAELSPGELADRMCAHPSMVSGIVQRVTRRVVRREIDPPG